MIEEGDSPEILAIQKGGTAYDSVVTALISPEELERCREEIPYRKDLDPETLSEAARLSKNGFIV